MEIRVRTSPRKFEIVHVVHWACPRRLCFWYRDNHIRSPAGYSGCSSRPSGRLACAVREGRGCPVPRPKPLNEPQYRKLRSGAWERISEEKSSG